MASKPTISGNIRINVYEVINRAVEDGIATGWRRAHKHTNTPGPEEVHSEIRLAVMNALGEVVEWE